ncbi:hypothetical protein V8F33_013238 [Rhypophila sp. PSN 637]
MCPADRGERRSVFGIQSAGHVCSRFSFLSFLFEPGVWHNNTSAMAVDQYKPFYLFHSILLTMAGENWNRKTKQPGGLVGLLGVNIGNWYMVFWCSCYYLSFFFSLVHIYTAPGPTVLNWFKRYHPSLGSKLLQFELVWVASDVIIIQS